MTDHLSFPLLRMLHDEHMATMALLEKLETLLRRFKPTSPPPKEDTQSAALLGEATIMLEHEITHHYAFEEGHLFPMFEEAFDPGIPMMLKAEHETIRPLAKDAAVLAKAARADGFSVAEWREFHDLALEIVEREVFHIQKEEMGFLPAINQILDPETEEELSLIYAEMKSG